MSSENSSSAPTVVPFTWMPGVLDGRQLAEWQQRPGGCRAPAVPGARCERDPNDDFEGPHFRQDVAKSMRVRQLFGGCTSGRAVRVRTRSPPGYRHAGMEGIEPMDRGRPISCSPARGPRERDYIPMLQRSGNIAARGHQYTNSRRGRHVTSSTLYR
jgi:hypothetical protein